MAVLAGVATAVRLHVSRGDDLDARDGIGMTPLMLAASKNKGAICELLLSSGADPTLTDPQGRDALALARAMGAADAVSVLERLWPKSDEESKETPEVASEEKTDTDSGVPSGAPHWSVYDAVLPGLVEEDDAFDLSEWEAEEDGPAPEDNKSLAETARAVHAGISMHTPVDNSEDWGDFAAFLPEFVDPLPNAIDEEGRWEIRRVLRRALREGSVPEREIATLYENQDGLLNESGEALLKLVLGDLGAETDERIESEVFVDAWEERGDDEDSVSEALAFLEDIGSGRIEPMRLYIRDLRGGRRLLTHEEEVSLGRDMGEGLDSALDALSSWPEGVAAFLAAADRVKSGEFEVESISEGRADDQEDALPGAVEMDESEEEGGNGVVHSLTAHGFLDKVRVVRKLEESAGRGGEDERALRKALEAASISPVFLARLAGASGMDNSDAAERLRLGVSSYAKARERMIVSNLRLVLSMVKRYQNLGLPLEDLVQEGNIGLMRAVDRYDWRRGFRFSTYATWWIRQFAIRAVADKGKTIRTPVHVNDTMLRIAREADELERATGRVPSADILAQRLSIPAGKVSALIARLKEPVPLHEPDTFGEAPCDSLVDESVATDPSAMAIRASLISTLEKMMTELDPRLAEVIALRFGLDGGGQRTLEETGEHYGLTRERIRQIEASALRKLAHPVRSETLRDFLDSSAASKKSKEQSLEDDARDQPPPLSPKIRPHEPPQTGSYTSSGDTFVTGGADRVVEWARADGAFVEDGSANGGEIVVRLRWEGSQTRGLIRELLNSGFRAYPGGEYRK
jgi:RNA polymerase primary sigma factor